MCGILQHKNYCRAFDLYTEMREQNLQGLLCHVAPASCDVMTINKGFLSELIASVGTYNMLLGALLDVGDSKAMEQFVVSSCTIRFFASIVGHLMCQ